MDQMCKARLRLLICEEEVPMDLLGIVRGLFWIVREEENLRKWDYQERFDVLASC